MNDLFGIGRHLFVQEVTTEARVAVAVHMARSTL